MLLQCIVEMLREERVRQAAAEGTLATLEETLDLEENEHVEIFGRGRVLFADDHRTRPDHEERMMQKYYCVQRIKTGQVLYEGPNEMGAARALVPGTVFGTGTTLVAAHYDCSIRRTQFLRGGYREDVSPLRKHQPVGKTGERVAAAQ